MKTRLAKVGLEKPSGLHKDLNSTPPDIFGITGITTAPQASLHDISTQTHLCSAQTPIATLHKLVESPPRRVEDNSKGLTESRMGCLKAVYITYNE